MKKNIFCGTLVLALLMTLSGLDAATISVDRAKTMVNGWLGVNRTRMGFAAGKALSSVTARPTKNAPLFYVAKFKPEGFAVISADDALPPIIAFSNLGTFDANDVLADIVFRDAANRLRAVKTGRFAAAEKKANNIAWARFEGTLRAGIDPIADPWVDPLMSSAWGQTTEGTVACYNYYTPTASGTWTEGDPANYPCGSLAAAMAQIIRFQQFPSEAIGAKDYAVTVNGATVTRTTRGGDGAGGVYDYAAMPLDPDVTTPDTERAMIGALCYDAGIAVHSAYTNSYTGAAVAQAATAFVNPFTYANAIYGDNYLSGDWVTLTTTQVQRMLNTNLDAGYPALIGLSGDSGNYACAVDGYGFDNEEAYHHLVLARNGSDNIWYNLPFVAGGNFPSFDYDTVQSCVYNIFPTGAGEIASGRVVDGSGNPISGATVSAGSLTTTTNARGIYSLKGLTSNASYTFTARASGFLFSSQVVNMGRSQSLPGDGYCGNRWGVDFTGTVTPTCSLTMTAAPEIGGTTDPAVGTHTINVGETIDIEATPAEGYRFTQWTVIGGATVLDMFSAATSLVPSGDCAAIANFELDPTSVTLTMAIVPDTAGSTNPAVGAHLVEPNTAINITAVAIEGYHFVSWSVTGGGTVANITAVSTTVTLVGDAAVTANFAANSNTASLTMAVTPDSKGFTNPAAATYSVEKNFPLAIEAFPIDAYHFISWAAVGNAEVADPYAAKTSVVISGDATVTARFAPSAVTVRLTLAATAGGSTDPDTGVRTIVSGEKFAAQAIADADYHFTNWTATPTTAVTIDSPSAPTSSFTVTDNATVTANFAPNTVQVTMTVAASTGGSTNPAVGDHTVTAGLPQTLTATAEDGYYFVKWMGSPTDVITIDSPNSATTTATLTNDATITAQFAPGSASHTLTIVAAEGGSTNPGAGTHSYNDGESFAIEAVPATNYRFTKWTGEPLGAIVIENATSATTTARISDNATLTPTFTADTPTATLTMAASPSAGGTTSPEIGAHTGQYQGQAIAILATPTSNYLFSHWEVSGDATVAAPTSANTTVTLSGDAAVTAIFSVKPKTGTITMVVEPEASGTTNPAIGSSTVEVAKSFEITAMPATGYHFVNWEAGSTVSVSEIASPSTTALLGSTDGGTITANFQEDSPKGILTMSVTPATGGTTSPVVGGHSVDLNQAIPISAAAVSGYHFLRWSVSGSGYITDETSANTTATLSGDAAVTATFEANTTTATLTMVIAPVTGGTIIPAEGDHTVNVGEAIALSAVAATDYTFSNWSVVGNAEVASPTAANTTVTLSGAATVTANFKLTQTQGTLTLAAGTGGTTSPAPGTLKMDIGSTLPISSIVEDSTYHFVKWTVSGGASIADTYSPATQVYMDKGDATVTAEFAKNIGTATLTIVATPDTAGTTNPGVGSRDVTIGTPINVSATALTGQYFVNWTVNGGVSINDPSAAAAIVTLTDDATLTANFAPDSAVTVALTLVASPDSSGSTNPGAGTYQVTQGVPKTIEAVPAADRGFLNWTFSGAVRTDNDMTDPIIDVVLTGAATVTATFTEDTGETTYALTMAVSPTGGGETNPGVGAHQVVGGVAQAISATAATGYHFTSWSVTGGAQVANLLGANTTVTLIGDGTVTANFAEDTEEVGLTLAVSPDTAGCSTNPGAGFRLVNLGEPISATAIAATYYHFSNWDVSPPGAAVFTDTAAATTTITVADTAVVTAYFTRDTTTATLAIAVTPDTAGTTNPGVYNAYTVNLAQATTISAIPVSDYYFSGWTATPAANATIASSSSATTTVTLSGNATVTASFLKKTGTAQLTLAVDADTQGSVNPGAYTYAVTLNEEFPIAALAKTGYRFKSWSIDPVQNGEIADATSASTTVALLANATVTASFETSVSTATLTMAINNNDRGSITPVPGVYTSVQVDSAFIVTAEADTGYKFGEWSGLGAITIAEPTDSTTTATIKGRATLTANFVVDYGDLTLTMAADPDTGGTVSPDTGAHTVEGGVYQDLVATPAFGFDFVEWVVQGNTVIDSLTSASTRVKLLSDATLTATFAVASLEVTSAPATCLVLPEGKFQVPPGESQSLSAVPGRDYKFVGWIATPSDQALFGDASKSATSLSLKGSATVSAVFAKIHEARDFNGDKRSDLLYRQESDGDVYIDLMNGLNRLGGGYLVHGAADWRVVGLGDFNGDEKCDVLFREENTGAIYLYLMNGATSFAQNYLYEGGDNAWTIAAVADFNGDREMDILFHHETENAYYLSLFDGFTTLASGYVTKDAGDWTVVGAGDFNGDGKADILYDDAATGALYVILMNGVNRLQEGFVLKRRDTSWKTRAIGDFNGDGKADLLLRSDTTGSTRVFLMNGVAITRSQFIYTDNVNWDIVGTGDLDGDGRLDIVLRHAVTGAVYMYLMDGLEIKAGGYLFQEADPAWRFIMPGDYNGDGKCDILMQYNGTPDAIYMLLMNGLTPIDQGFIWDGSDARWRLEK